MTRGVIPPTLCPMALRGLAVLALAVLATSLGGVEPARAARPPVVMIVLDELPVDSLLGADGEIDARRFPNFARLASLSTWFPNAQSVYDGTEKAVPALLAGTNPGPGLGSTWRDHPRSVFTYLGRLGYEMHVREEVTTVCPPRLCRRTRNYGRPRPNILFGRRERLERTIRTIRRQKRPAFTFHHVALPHVPWSYMPSGRKRVGGAGGALPDFGAPPGFGDPYLTLHNEQRYLLQLGFVDREIGKLLRRMRRQRLLARSLLVVVADHGVSFGLGVDDRRSVTEANVHEIAPVPLFVKRPGQTAGVEDRAYVRTTDVLPTIADILGRPLGERVDGRSAFSAAVGRRTGVEIVTRDFSRTISVPAAEMEIRRALNVARRVDLFGTGPWRNVFRIGPHVELLGRRTADLARVPAGRARARFVAPGRRTRYALRGHDVPVWAAGRIRGSSRAGGRDLAVAVNGRVRAVARSFRLDGKATEWFSATVPEASLRRGANRFELFEVRAGDDDSPVLRPLGETG